MIFLVLICEGRTEMDFVQRVLSGHLAPFGVKTHQIEVGKRVKHDIPEAPGGVIKWEPVYRHITASLRQYSSMTSRVTTMLDLYAFPSDFPGYDTHVGIADGLERVRAFEDEIQAQVRDNRFIPYLQLHEFEALVFARPDELLEEFEEKEGEEGLSRLLADIGETPPEDVDLTPAGAPSKRLERCFTGRYRKRDMGPRVAGRIGMAELRLRCPHFGEWLARLERLSETA